MELFMNPLISIIVPVYNTQEYIAEAIESIMAQTYSPIELILIDDGSIDASGQICDSYANVYPNIHVLHTQNGGVGKARNVGLEHAAGEYICFLDSDDFFEPYAIETLYQNLVRYRADISIGSLRYIDEEKKQELYIDTFGLPQETVAMNQHQYLTLSFTKILSIIITNRLFKQCIWKQLRFVEDIIHEDDAAFVDVMRRCNTIVCTDQVTMNYRKRPRSIMQTAFSVKNLVKISFLSDRIQYFLERKYFNCCYFTYFQGMQLISKAFLSSDKALRKEARNKHAAFRKLALKMLPHSDSFAKKIALLLFYLNLDLYTFIRYRLRPRDLEQL